MSLVVLHTFKKATAPLLSDRCAVLVNKTLFSTAQVLEIEGSVLPYRGERSWMTL